MEITDTFYAALEIMGIGMVGIFVFMLFFGIVIHLLRKIFPFREEPQTEESDR